MADLRKLTFWGASAGVGWVLVGYPAALAVLPARRWRESEATPSTTVLIPTYREYDVLPTKLASVEALDYPPERVQIVVAVDGDPALADLARRACPKAQVVLVPSRSGKPTALTRGLREATGEIVLLTDAHNRLEPGSLRAAARHFADPAVSAVTGRWAEHGSAYDRYEHLLRCLETRSGSVAGVFGGFTAVRRDRLPELPLDVVNEDFWLLCRLVGAGGRVVYEPNATSSTPPLVAGRELERRMRISAGRILAVSELRGLPPGFAWRLLSHKVGRLALPFLLLSMLLSSAALSRRRFYRGAWAAQTSVYGAGALGIAGWSPSGPMGTFLRAARQFTLGNVAVGLGVIRGLRRRQDVAWKDVR